jgi:hypothetical protein
MRTEIVETGNWVSNDLYNGRVVRIPNSAALKGPVFNCSQGFRFVWDEIKVPLTGDSNHLLAREMLLRIADEAVAGYLEGAETAWSEVTYNFRIANVSLAPTATLMVNGGSLEFTLSYIVDYTNRTAMQDRLFSKIVDEIKNSKGELTWASSSGSGRGSQVIHQHNGGDQGSFGVVAASVVLVKSAATVACTGPWWFTINREPLCPVK